MHPVIKIKTANKTFLIPHERRDTLKENVLSVFKRKTYEKFNALHNVNLEVNKGDFLAIVGKNGSGKSTLLKLIAGIYQPSEGNVSVVGDIAPFLELGIGFQGDLTGRENIYLNATILGLSRPEINEKFDDMVSFAEVEKFLDLKIKNYSSGMKARLAFAIAKEADADIYLCDEVLAVGDEQFQQKCMTVFDEWKRRGKTILFVSHNAELIKRFCNRAILLDGGIVVMDDSVENVLNNYHQRFTI